MQNYNPETDSVPCAGGCGTKLNPRHDELCSHCKEGVKEFDGDLDAFIKYMRDEVNRIRKADGRSPIIYY